MPPLVTLMSPAAVSVELPSRLRVVLAPSFTAPAELVRAEVVALTVAPWMTMSPEALTGALVRVTAAAPRTVTAPWATLTGPVSVRLPVAWVRKSEPEGLSVVPASVVVACDFR